MPNALEVVLRKGHLDMLREPLLQTILRYKWETFARWQVSVCVWGGGRGGGVGALEAWQTFARWQMRV